MKLLKKIFLKKKEEKERLRRKEEESPKWIIAVSKGQIPKQRNRITQLYSSTFSEQLEKLKCLK